MAAITLWAVMPSPAFSQDPQRIVSLNLCADQLLLALVEPERIAALSPNARDPALSHHADLAEHLPSISASAEEVLMLHPDLVLAGPFAGAEAKAFLRAAGLRVVEVPVPETLAGVARQLRDMGALLGTGARAEAVADRFEQAIAAARAQAAGPRPRALYLQRRGIVTGRGTLMNDLLETAGLRNAVTAAGFARYELEQLLTIEADLIVMDTEPAAADQGSAMLVHPAVKARFGAVPRIIVPLSSLVCPGPWTADAVERLAEAARQVRAQ